MILIKTAFYVIIGEVDHDNALLVLIGPESSQNTNWLCPIPPPQKKKNLISLNHCCNTLAFRWQHWKQLSLSHSAAVTCPYAKLTMRQAQEPVGLARLNDADVSIKSATSEREYLFSELGLSALPSTARNQAYVTVPDQEPLPAMSLAHEGRPNLGAPPSYLEASEFHLYINCSLFKQKIV